MSDLDAKQKAKLFLTGRKTAYQQVFNPENQHTKRVLKDLARFCRASESTFKEDARHHAILEGRREVFLRISRYLNLTPDELWKYYGGDNDGH